MKNEASQKKELLSLTNTALKASAWQSNDKAELAIILGQTCVLQRVYGRSAAELETLVEGFAWALAEYPSKKVIEGISTFIRQSPLVPTPYEIRQIIDPIKPPFVPDWSVYNRYKELLKAEGKYALNDDEFKYMNACEKFSLGKINN